MRRKKSAVLSLVAALGVGLGCASAPQPVPGPKRAAWLPPEKKCPWDAMLHMEKMGLKPGDRIPVIVDALQDHAGSARYANGAVHALPRNVKVDLKNVLKVEGELATVRIGGRLYVAGHRVFGRYDRVHMPAGYSVPFCGVLLDPRWDRDGEGLISYSGPERGTAVVQDTHGVIEVVERFP